MTAVVVHFKNTQNDPNLDALSIVTDDLFEHGMIGFNGYTIKTMQSFSTLELAKTHVRETYGIELEDFKVIDSGYIGSPAQMQKNREAINAAKVTETRTRFPSLAPGRYAVGEASKSEADERSYPGPGLIWKPDDAWRPTVVEATPAEILSEQLFQGQLEKDAAAGVAAAGAAGPAKPLSETYPYKFETDEPAVEEESSYSF